MNANEKPTCDLTGVDGNVFAIVGAVKRTLQNAGFKDEAKEMLEAHKIDINNDRRINERDCKL